MCSPKKNLVQEYAKILDSFVDRKSQVMVMGAPRVCRVSRAVGQRTRTKA